MDIDPQELALLLGNMQLQLLALSKQVKELTAQVKKDEPSN